ncbi:MAG: HD domain-containing phosphohydrolase [Bacillota bacterium]
MISKRKNHSISFILTATFIVLIGIPLLILAGFVWRYSLARTTEDINQQNLNLARSMAGQIDGYLTAPIQAAQNIKNFTSQNIRGEEIQKNYLGQVLADNEQIESILLTDENGEVVSSVPNELNMNGLLMDIPADFTEQDGSLNYWSNTYTSHRNQNLTTRFVTKYADGFIFMEIDLSQLNQYISGLTTNHDVLIFDRQGVPLAGTQDKPIREQKNYYQYDFVRQALRGEEAVGKQFSPLQNNMQLISSTPLEDIGWAVAVFMPVEEAYTLVNQISTILFIGIALALTLGIFVSWRNLKYITDPLRKLTQETEKVAAGHRDTQDLVRIEGYKEIERLTSSFGKMIGEIKAKEEEINANQLELQASYEQLEAFNEEVTKLHGELEDSYSQVNEQLEQLEKIISLTSNLTSAAGVREEDFLRDLLATATQIVPEADYGTVFRYGEDKVNFVAAIGHDYDKLKDLEIEKEVFAREGNEEIKIIKNIHDTTAPYLNPEMKAKYLQAAQKIGETMTFDLYVEGDKKIGLSLDTSANQQNNFNKSSEKAMQAFYSIASAFYSVQYYNALQSEFHQEILASMLRLLSIHDQYTESHSQNVGELSRQLAQELELSKEEVKNAYWAGLVHDIGKTLISDKILNKDSRLDPDEFKVIEDHPRWGYEALKTSSRLEKIAQYVLYHHERIDGEGYPVGLTGEEIPEVAKIIHVADAWDAMTSKRSYRDPLSREEAIKELRVNAGSQFSEKVIAAFFSLYDKGES